MITVKKEIKKKDENSYITETDMGISNFVTVSVNNVYDAPKSLINKYNKIGKLQKKLSLKKRESNNYIKLLNKINKLYDKRNNIRDNFLHKLSTSIISENQVIVIEDLDVKSMV